MKKILYFGAPWCGGCQTMNPIMTSIESAEVQKVNADSDEGVDLSQKYDIMTLPTIIILENDVEVQRLVGVQSKETIEQYL